MKNGLSTIQQTLTPEAASVLNQSIAEAARRSHGQATPLHVAATLLASPSGYLRQACIRSHSNSSHPLQCRALELCFSVALDRLPTAQNIPSAGFQPPLSNALMAALKRSQAHQRRGCMEQQQQPLLAVKVELEQLIISILDDPSVSRIMREASFSSPAVKATIEKSLNLPASNSSLLVGAIEKSLNSPALNNSVLMGGRLALRPSPPTNRNLYLNPRLQQGSSAQFGPAKLDDVKRVIDILLRTKKRNPVLVGELEPEVLVRELIQSIEKRGVGEELLKNVQTVSLEKEFGSDRLQILTKLKQLRSLVETRINGSRNIGVILDLGDLKWVVEQPIGFGVWDSVTMPIRQERQQIISDMGRAAVAEIANLLVRFREGGHQLWIIGTATCETYLRCQVYHPSMENDWDLQAVPITSRSPHPASFSRNGSKGITSSSTESISPSNGFSVASTVIPSSHLPEKTSSTQGFRCCPACMENYEHELAKIVEEESEKSSMNVKSESLQTLPKWMQMAKLNNSGIEETNQAQAKDKEPVRKQKSIELQRKWIENCQLRHPCFHKISSNCSQNLVTTVSPQMNLNLMLSNHYDDPPTPPDSPIRTDLALGCPKTPINSIEKTQKECVGDFQSCISSKWQDKFFKQQNVKHANVLDSDSFKIFLKSLIEKVEWQPEAASRLASTMIECKLGNGKCRGNGTKGDTWLLFAGPDKVGKKKMALALSELLSCSSPIIIRLGSRVDDDGESNMSFRGKTVLDQIAEAVRQNPFSVILLEDLDTADTLLQGSLKQAMEQGRLINSHGREIGLGNVTFVMTADQLPKNLRSPLISYLDTYEDKLDAATTSTWKLKIIATYKTSKRRAEWLNNEDRLTKLRRNASPACFPIDLNLFARSSPGDDNDDAEGSHDSSDLTVELQQSAVNKQSLSPSLPNELVDSVDGLIMFKPVNFGPLQTKVANSIAAKFTAIVTEGPTLEVDKEVVEHIAYGLWFGQTRLEEWSNRVLSPSFEHLKSISALEDVSVVKLVRVPIFDQSNRDWLPSKIDVLIDSGI